MGSSSRYKVFHAAHLYPWRATSMDNYLFGTGSSRELFSWRNGLILHKVVEAALNADLIAIAPRLRPKTIFEKIKQLRKDMEAGSLLRTIVRSWRGDVEKIPKTFKMYWRNDNIVFRVPQATPRGMPREANLQRLQEGQKNVNLAGSQ